MRDAAGNVLANQRRSGQALYGDLLVFDGGRHFHQILPVVGPRRRWTVGGFMAPTRDRTAWLRWS